MKGRTKKLFALLFAVVLIMQFVPSVANASEEAPYSLEYLNSIQDVAYVKYIAIDDDGDMTNQTMEVYDAFDLWLNENGSWSAIVKPFRDAFKAAGFIESLEEDTKEYDNQIRYLFTKEADSSYEIFEILSEKRAYSILNESAVVYILHTTIMLQNTKNDVSVEPSGNTSSSSEGFDRFVKVQSYTEGRFSDVSAGNWFASGVQSAYELGLMKGNSETTFNPNGDMTIAETLTIACRIHDIYHGSNTDFSGGSPWYQPYIDYAIQNGIIRDGVYPDYSAKAKRFQFANIIYASLPSETWTVLNSVTELPDVKSTDWFSSTVFALYNAGILTGSDQYGTFNPHSTIKRSEIATIATRVAVPSSRISFTLQDPPVESQPDPVNNESNLPAATAEAKAEILTLIANGIQAHTEALQALLIGLQMSSPEYELKYAKDIQKNIVLERDYLQKAIQLCEEYQDLLELKDAIISLLDSFSIVKGDVALGTSGEERINTLQMFTFFNSTREDYDVEYEKLTSLVDKLLIS